MSILSLIEYSPIIDGMICFFMVLTYLGIREVLGYFRTKHKTEMAAITQSQKAKDINGMIDGVVSAIPEVEKTLAQQKAAFAAMNPAPSVEDQGKVLKPIEERLSYMKMIRDNEALVRYAAPYVDGLLKGFLKMFK